MKRKLIYGMQNATAESADLKKGTIYFDPTVADKPQFSCEGKIYRIRTDELDVVIPIVSMAALYEFEDDVVDDADGILDHSPEVLGLKIIEERGQKKCMLNIQILFSYYFWFFLGLIILSLCLIGLNIKS